MSVHCVNPVSVINDPNFVVFCMAFPDSELLSVLHWPLEVLKLGDELMPPATEDTGLLFDEAGYNIMTTQAVGGD